tara:strand:+ start:137 stop:451 length:315 start_codon:yes stop_codon:yes gene_type:complete
MDMKQYGKSVEDLIITTGKDRMIENTLGLVGESGEVAEKIKKCIRDNHEPNKMEIIKELGDVLFYVTALANHIGSDLETVAIHNIVKLQDRKSRNKIQGSGDDR